jgi:hypothetical protein
MIETWEALVETCKAYRSNPALVVWPRRFREHQQASARAVILREMAKSGVSAKQIALVCPMSARAINRIVKSK